VTNYEPDFGLNVSADGGSTWAPGGFVAWVTALAVDPTDNSIVYAGLQDGRVFRRTNGTWISVSAGLPTEEILTIAIDPLAPDIIYVGTADGLYRRVGRGHGWHLVSSGFEVPWTDALAVDSRAPRRGVRGYRGRRRIPERGQRAELGAVQRRADRPRRDVVGHHRVGLDPLCRHGDTGGLRDGHWP
jgi:hypothetical protein